MPGHILSYQGEEGENDYEVWDRNESVQIQEYDGVEDGPILVELVPKEFVLELAEKIKEEAE